MTDQQHNQGIKSGVPTGPLDSEPIDYRPTEADLRAVLAAAGVELGEYDERIVRWLADAAGWGALASIASWVQRANRPDSP